MPVSEIADPKSGGDPGGGDPGGRRSAGAGRKPRLVFLGVGIVLAAGLAIGLFSGVGSTSSGRPQAGSALPAFSLPKLGGGGKVAVPADGGGDGRPAILLFFASWCTPCQKEVPALAATYRQQEASKSRLAKVALVGIDGSDPTGNALSFVHASGVTFPVGADATYQVTQGIFDFTGLPESVFVTANGTIAGIHYGGLSKAAFVSWEQKLLSTTS